MKNKDESDKTIWTCFRKKIHIIDDLKTNMLINNDIIKSKNVNVSSNKRTIYINNCKIIVSIKIKSFEIAVIKSVHLQKIIIISFHLKFSMKIHYLTVLDFRNFLFEFDEIDSLIAYAHLVDAFIKTILFKNESNRSIKISRNYRLKKFIEIKYINVYHINDENDFENQNFAARRLRSKHQKNWFKKIITKIVTIFATMIVINNVKKSFTIELVKSLTNILFTSIVVSTTIFTFTFSKTILSNDVIIYNLDYESNIVTSLQQMIKFFFNL